MATFGTSTEPKPKRIDELLDTDLMTRLGHLDVLSRKIFQGKVQGERRSRKRGLSVEFADYRQYVAGDDLRFIDWNVFARLDRLFIKLFIEEEDLSLILVVDASASMDWGNPNKFIFAQKLAMALGYIGLVNHNRVSLMSFGEEGLQVLPNLRGRRRTQEMGNWLLEKNPVGSADFNETMRTIATGRQGKGVMVLLSDFLYKEGYEKGLRFLAGGRTGFDTFCVQTLAPEEIDPGQHGLTGNLRLTDIEDSDAAEVTVSPSLLRKYKSNLDQYCGQLQEFCVRRGISQLTVDTSTDMNVLLVDYLRRRGLLK
ncbi:MAG: DUF58 domain-containing protein [Phycisphaerales bacterium]|nr:DUF58 domain-containing protein [Phycisphaerales bacterium]